MKNVLCQVPCSRGQEDKNRLEVCKHYIMLAHTTNLHGILMLNLSIDKHIQGQMYKKAPGHGHFLEMKNSTYHCPSDLTNNKVNAIYIVYKIRDYDSIGAEHNYLHSCGMDNNHCGVSGGPYNYMGISNFLASYYNPCQRDKWNVVCVV